MVSNCSAQRLLRRVAVPAAGCSRETKEVGIFLGRFRVFRSITTPFVEVPHAHRFALCVTRMRCLRNVSRVQYETAFVDLRTSGQSPLTPLSSSLLLRHGSSLSIERRTSGILDRCNLTTDCEQRPFQLTEDGDVCDPVLNRPAHGIASEAKIKPSIWNRKPSLNRCIKSATSQTASASV
jgi:hypothetical protein